MRTGFKNFDWAKALPDVVDNYNKTFHRTIKATPNEVWEGEKKNPIERKVVETVLKKGMHVRIKRRKAFLIKVMCRRSQIEKAGKKNTLKNLTTGNQLKRTFTDEELEQTFAKPEERKKKLEKPEQELRLVPIKQKLNPKETISQRKEHRVIKHPVWQSL